MRNETVSSAMPNNRPMGEEIAQELEARIYSGVLQPGERLVERQLAQEFNVSRQPIRDALQFLKQHGLATALPTRGMIVATLDSKEIDDIFTVRESLEALSARLACQHVVNGASVERLQQLLRENKQAIANKDNETAFKTNAEFHEEVIALADNPVLTETLRSIFTRMHWLSGDTLDLAAVHAEHVELYEAIVSGDVKLADVTARHHTAAYKERTRKKLSQSRRAK